MLMDRHDVQPIRSQRLQYGSDLIRSHRNVSGDLCIRVTSIESCPGIQSHSRIDGRAHFLDAQVVASNRDLVDLSRLLSFMPHQLHDLGRIDLSRGDIRTVSALRARMLGGFFADQINSGLYLLRKIRRRAMPVYVHIENPGALEEKMIMQ